MPRLTKQQRVLAQAAELEKQLKLREEFKKNLPAKILYEFIPQLLERGIKFDFLPNYQREDGHTTIQVNNNGEWYDLKAMEEWQYEGDLLQVIRDYDYEQDIIAKKEAAKNVALAKLTLEDKKILNLI